jgi:hypothetical protein
VSLFNIGGAIKGAVSGFSSGGIWGGIGGAVLGGFQGNKNPAKTKNVGVQPQYNVTKGKVQLNPALSPVAMPGVSTPTSQLTGYAPALSLPSSTGSWSASGLVRQSGAGGNPGSLVIPALWGGAGSTGTFTPMPNNGIQSLAPGYSPMAMYHRFYTKKGTLRRVTKNGVPYKPPHMNPMNPRAARRAIRRIRGARKLLQRIERSLPKARTHRAPVRRHAA